MPFTYSPSSAFELFILAKKKRPTLHHSTNIYIFSFCTGKGAESLVHPPCRLSCFSFMTYVAVPAVAVCAASAVFGSRWKRTEKARAELNEEYRQSSSALETLQEERSASLREVQEKARWAEGRLETLQIIWKDRMDRFHEKLQELHGCITALPEAIGILHGAENHFNYMATELKRYVEFDVAAATVHNFGILLSYADVVGIGRVSTTIQQLLQQDALIDAVCTSVETTKTVEAPKSMSEASDSFSFCVDQLLDARNRIIERYGGVAMVHPAHQKGSIFLDGLHMALRSLRLNTLTSGQQEEAKRREAIESLFKSERRLLQSKEDVLAAMRYVASLRCLLTDGDGTSRSAAKDPLTLAIQKDHRVQLALQQAELWRNSAGTFLLQEQAREALSSYHVLLSESMTRLHLNT
eukprot:gene10165-7119_t